MRMKVRSETQLEKLQQHQQLSSSERKQTKQKEINDRLNSQHNGDIKKRQFQGTAQNVGLYTTKIATNDGGRKRKTSEAEKCVEIERMFNTNKAFMH